MLGKLHPDFDDEAGPVGHNDTVSQVAFSANGRELASSGWDGTLCVWDLTTLKQRHLLDGHVGAVNGVAYLSPTQSWTPCLADLADEFLLSGGADGTLRIWNASTGKAVRVTPGFGSISHLCLDPDGKHVWLADTPRPNPPHYFLLCDLTKTKDSARIIRQVGGIRWIAASTDERYVAVSNAAGHLMVWNIEKRLHDQPDHFWQAEQGELMGLAFSPDATLLASAGSDGTVKLWNPTNKELRGVCRGHEGDAFDVAFSPDGHRLASCGKDGTVRIWDVSLTIRDGTR
jgi:WD40 repeat protein